jgi:hypothetical protein
LAKALTTTRTVLTKSRRAAGTARVTTSGIANKGVYLAGAKGAQISGTNITSNGTAARYDTGTNLRSAACSGTNPRTLMATAALAPGIP